MQRRLLFLSLILCMFPVYAQSVAELQSGKEYDLVLDDGEEMKKILIVETDAETVFIVMAGLKEQLKIPRKAIKSAELIVRKPFFRGYETALFGDFQIALADLRSLNSSFSAGTFSLIGHFSNRIRFLRFNAVNADLSFAHVTDGERRIEALGLILGPRWNFDAFGLEFFFGIGGGVTGLYLNSYTFNRLSYAPTGYAQAGAGYKLYEKIHLYVVIHANYWSDSRATLASGGLRLGVGYSW